MKPDTYWTYIPDEIKKIIKAKKEAEAKGKEWTKEKRDKLMNNGNNI